LFDSTGNLWTRYRHDLFVVAIAFWPIVGDEMVRFEIDLAKQAIPSRASAHSIIHPGPWQSLDRRGAFTANAVPRIARDRVVIK
jgi:hypothetical protein